MELDFYDELDKQEQENENNEYWEQQYDELQIKYDCLMEAFKIQKDILTSKNKTINKAIEYLEELISDTKGMIDNYNNEDKKQTIKRFIEDLKTDLEHYKYLQLLLRGEDNE